MSRTAHPAYASGSSKISISTLASSTDSYRAEGARMFASAVPAVAILSRLSKAFTIQFDERSPLRTTGPHWSEHGL